MDCDRRIIHISNLYYNEGLERAQVRDLSGAAESLRKSLGYNKMHILARNLLGLVYFEMGETVDALSEWVISKSLNPEDNGAEQYLAAVQSNGNKLDALNQTIKKYNQALLYCRQGSKDLAVIQLKKVLALNPKLVKGHQLLALLYMEEGRYDLAKKSLRNAGRIDSNNTTTLRYLKEANQQLHQQPARKNGQKEKEELLSYQSGNDTIIRPAKFKDNSTFSIVLNILVGLVLGVLITCFLVVPGVRQKAVSENSQSQRESNDTISTKNQTIKTLEKQIADLEAQISQAETDKSASENAIAAYNQLLTAYEAYTAGNYAEAGTALEGVDAQVFTGKAGDIYQSISAKVNEEYMATLYQEGKSAYDGSRFPEAAEKLQKVVDLDAGYQDGNAVYYLAQAYRRSDQNALAITYYQKVIELIPGTDRAKTAEKYLEQLQQAATPAE